MYLDIELSEDVFRQKTKGIELFIQTQCWTLCAVRYSPQTAEALTEQMLAVSSVSLVMKQIRETPGFFSQDETFSIRNSIYTNHARSLAFFVSTP